MIRRDDISAWILKKWRGIWWEYIPGYQFDLQFTPGLHPNIDFRPWIETQVGEQYVDWDWRLGPADKLPSLEVKFRKGKTDHALVAMMMWK